MRRRSTNGRRVCATASTSGSSGILESERFESPEWSEFQRVFANLCFGRIAERRNDRFAFVPIGELIGVVAAPDLAGFAGGNEKDGVIPIGQIGDEAHRRPMAFCGGADAVAGAGLRLAGDAEQP